MTKESVVESIREILSEYLGMSISSIDSRWGLTDYNINSIDMMELVGYFEEKFDLDLTPVDFLGADSINTLAEVIAKKINKNQAEPNE